MLRLISLFIYTYEIYTYISIIKLFYCRAYILCIFIAVVLFITCILKREEYVQYRIFWKELRKWRSLAANDDSMEPRRNRKIQKGRSKSIINVPSKYPNASRAFWISDIFGAEIRISRKGKDSWPQRTPSGFIYGERYIFCCCSAFPKCDRANYWDFV